MKKYKVTYEPLSTECVISIDEDFVIDHISTHVEEPYTTRDAIRSMVEFWSGYEGRLRNNEGDYTKTFLQQLSREINIIQIIESYNLTGVIEAFNDREGWFTLDGSSGIWINFIDDVDFAHSDYEIEEVSA
jgi:hypothetical protein